MEAPLGLKFAFFIGLRPKGQSGDSPRPQVALGLALRSQSTRLRRMARLKKLPWSDRKPPKI